MVILGLTFPYKHKAQQLETFRFQPRMRVQTVKY